MFVISNILGTKEEFLWLTGGQSFAGAVSGKTEKLIVAKDGKEVMDSNWESGEELQIPLAGHCIAKLTDDTVLLSGGFSFDFFVLRTATGLIRLDLSF